MNVFSVKTAARFLVVGALIGTGASSTLANESPVVAAALVRGDTRSFATFVVNSQERGEHIVLLKADGVYAAVDDLRAAGLSIPPRAGLVATSEYVRLADLAPEIEAAFDPQGPTVRLDARSSDSLTQRSSISILSGRERRGDARRERSGYLNYSLRTDSTRTWSAAQELTLSDASKTLFLAGTVDAGRFRRSLGNLTWNNDTKRRRLVIGDVLADSGEHGSSQIIEGVSVARSFDSTPYEQRTTSPTLYGTALTPSMADVYVNGALIRSVDVPPGTFDFRNLPTGAGANDARIVVRDAFGHTQILSSRYFGANSILRAGETDYAYSLGESRGAGPAALARYGIGLSSSTTVGAHAELGKSFQNFGTSIDHTGRLGIFHVAVAQSRDRSDSGFAGALRCTFGGRNLWATAALEAATADYMTLAQRAFPERTTLEERINVGMRPFRGNYTSNISYNASHSRLGSFSRQLSWQQTVPVARGVSLLVSSGVSMTPSGSRPDFSVFLTRFGGRNSRDTTNLSFRADGGVLQPAIEVQHATPLAGGAGYDANVYPSGRMLSAGRLAVRSSIGNLDMDYDLARDGSLSGAAALSGGVVFAGKYAHVSQPIADSFALVKVAGGERVEVLVDNQDVGTTDRNGFLVLPDVRSYYGERIGIVRDGGPVNLNVSSNDQEIVVASRRGAVAEFNASIVTAIIGKVTVSENGRKTIPVFGKLSLASTNGTTSSDLDGAGRFYFEDMAPGKYAATIRYGGGECRFTLAVPHTTTIEQNIGEFTCVGS